MLTLWKACPAIRGVTTPGYAHQPRQAPRPCSLASWVALQWQLYMDMQDGHAGVLRTKKWNSGVGHACPEASLDSLLQTYHPHSQLVTFSLPSLGPCPLCEFRAVPATCPSESWLTPKTRGCFLSTLTFGVKTGERRIWKHVEAGWHPLLQPGLTGQLGASFIPQGLSFLR